MRPIYFFVCFIVILFHQTGHGFEEYYTTPGTRAQGMAGNFVALATDSSAIWYNPAGLGFNSVFSGLSGDVTIEFGDYVAFDVDNEVGEVFLVDSQIKYAGGTFGPIGYAYFRPYEFFSLSQGEGTDYAVQTSYTELKFAFGFETFDGIAIGSSLDMVIQDYESDCTSCDRTTGDLGFGFSLGILAKYRFDNGFELRFGATTRSDIEIDTVGDDFQTLPARPFTTAVGGAIGMPIFATYLILTVQSEEITYNEQRSIFFADDSNNVAFNPGYTRTGFGGEWAFYPSDSTTLFLRFGTAITETDQAPTFIIFDEIEVSTWGIGLAFGNGLVLDIAREKRDITYTPQDYSESIELTSYSMSWSF